MYHSDLYSILCRFVIGGDDYELSSEHFYEKYEDDDTQDTKCATTISSLDIHQEGQSALFIVGDSFMQYFYTVFDRDNDQVGMALAKH